MSDESLVSVGVLDAFDSAAEREGKMRCVNGLLARQTG